jgi:rhamnogalacturonan endolyase
MRSLLLIVLATTACRAQPVFDQPFQYRQEFAPKKDAVVSHQDWAMQDRLVFADVREEGALSSWKVTNWRLIKGGIEAVGSRRAEWQRREDYVKQVLKGAEPFVRIRGYRVPWLTLSMGDLDWKDYTVTTTVVPRRNCSAGVAVRYLNSRQYYLLLLEDNNTAVLYLRTQDKESMTALHVEPFQLQPERTYAIAVTVAGQRITCAVDGRVVASVADPTLGAGKVALIADNPVRFGPVAVQGVLRRRVLPPLPFCATPRLVQQVRLPAIEGSRDIMLLDVDTDGQLEIVSAESTKAGYAYRAFKFDGTELWRIAGIQHPITEGGDHPIAAFDINGDGKNEVVLTRDFRVEVREGKTAKLLYSASTPPSNPYLENSDYPYPRLLGDALCPVKLSRTDPPGLYVKDRYTNIWMYDHKLNLLWHKALGTGHFPLPVDIDEDGVEEVMACYTLLRNDGSEAWKIKLGDHADNIAYESLDPGKKRKYFYVGSDMGLLEIDPHSGRLQARRELGHVQYLSLADYVPEQPGLELLVETQWREDGIHYLLDRDLKITATWQGPTDVIQPLPWGKDGRALVLGGNEVLDPVTGRLIMKIPGTVLRVVDDSRWGNSAVIVRDGDVVRVFAADQRIQPPRMIRPYEQFNSEYLPKVALRPKEQP